MMKKNTLFILITLFVSSLTQSVNAVEIIKIGTLVPKSSPWGQVLEVWAKSVKEKSGGKLELQIFYNGQQGDEGAIVGKMKAGQIDGAMVSAVGLGKIYKPTSAIEMPGLFKDWAKLDMVRDAMKAEFEKGMSDAGFTLTGWCDIGMARFMSKGFALQSPTNLQGKKPYSWRDDSKMSILFQIIGGITPIPLNTPEVLPNLNTGAINTIYASTLFAEQVQWTSKLDHIAATADGFCIGGIVFSAKRLDALSADLKSILMDTGKIAANALTKRIRNEDNAAFVRLKGKMTVVSRTPEVQAKWDAIFKQTRQRLAQGTFSPDLVTKLEELAGK
jgi:TRAP-type C4-dicarboxylate transport system substrate-binding protein